MRTMIATILASSLLVSSAIAADVAPLSPGKPAGIKQADIEAGGVLLWVGVGALAAGIAFAVSSSQGNSSSTTTQ
jgi:hypothetical protein